MYKLYSMQRSGNSYKVRLALAFLDAPYRAIELPLGFLVMVAFYIIVLRRALADNSTSRHLHTQIAAA